MVRNLVVLGLSSHPSLTKSICAHLGVGPADMILGKFAVGETRVQIQESVRGKDVYIIQSGGGPINDYLIELCITVQACTIASAKRITVVAPLFPYSRGTELPVSSLPHGLTAVNDKRMDGAGIPVRSNGRDYINGEKPVIMSSTAVDSKQLPAAKLGALTNGHTESHKVSKSKSGEEMSQSKSTAPNVAAILPTLETFRPSPGYRPWVAQCGTLVANLLVCAGANHIMTMELHDPQYQGYFDIPVDNLYGRPGIQSYITTHIPDYKSAIIVSPDAGGAKRATSIADRLLMDFALIHKERNLASGGGDNPSTEETAMNGTGAGKTQSRRSNSDSMMLVGNVQNRTCIMIDDMADTSTTITRAAKLLKRSGAKKVYALVTHGIFSGDAIDRINETEALDKVVVTNTVAQDDHLKRCSKLEVLEVGHIIGEAIRRVHYGESLSQLFNQ